MEKVISTLISAWLKFLHAILSEVFLFYSQHLKEFISSIHNAPTKEHEEKLLISGEDVKMVMNRLGILLECDSDGDDKLRERYSESEVSGVFEEEEPSLEEVRDAFEIFDENKDGFIDGEELHRVLCCLGFMKEGSVQVEKCEEMISAAVRKDGSDGKLDFNAFVRFMERCF